MINLYYMYFVLPLKNKIHNVNLPQQQPLLKVEKIQNKSHARLTTLNSPFPRVRFRFVDP